MSATELKTSPDDGAAARDSARRTAVAAGAMLLLLPLEEETDGQRNVNISPRGKRAYGLVHMWMWQGQLEAIYQRREEEGPTTAESSLSSGGAQLFPPPLVAVLHAAYAFGRTF